MLMNLLVLLLYLEKVWWISTFLPAYINIVNTMESKDKDYIINYKENGVY